MELSIENLMNTAIEEMKNGQHPEASKHFDLVVINDSTNIDAPFFCAYCNCYDIKLGEMSNAAINFTNAFYRYVDAVKALNDPIQEKEKLDYAVVLLTELVSMYKFNAKKQMLTAPSIGVTISSSANTMNSKCISKLSNVNANISAEVLSSNKANSRSNIGTGMILSVLLGLGIGAFVFWMILWW